ncbi:MAG: hypothetical protein EB101_01965 [Chitinophagia bacterium]|nr:hypothetical protein [Chitinophagia bacterium]
MSDLHTFNQQNSIYMYRNTISAATLFVLVLSMGIYSCQKDKQSTDPADEKEALASRTVSESDAEAEIIYDGIFDDAMGVNEEVGMGGTGIFGRLNACPTVTVTRNNPPAPFPVRVVLDFGTGCVGNDGHFRKGKIIHIYTNRLLLPGAVVETSFDNFYFDSTKIEGAYRIKNTTEVLTRPRYQTNVINGKLIRPNGNFTLWNSEKILTQIEGGITVAFPMDDVFSTTGAARGQVRRDTTTIFWNSTILDPLIKKMNCRWIVKGTVRTVRENVTSGERWQGVINFDQSIFLNV